MKRKTNSICLALTMLLTLAVAGTGLPGARAQSPHRVGLVVRFADDNIVTRCIEFSEPQISGYDVLTRSGLNVVASFDSGMGAAICAIEGIGCPVETCLTCATPDYWSYWHLEDGAWVYSQVGASGYMAHDGGVEGWSWGAGVPPPVVPFDQICAPPPTATPSPTDTPPPPTATSPPPPTATSPAPLPTATSPPPTPVVWFRLDDNPIPVGTCTMVRWDTSNASEIYLDEERVDLNGSREVCPATPQEYHLRVVSVTGEQTYTLVLGVTGPTPTSTVAVVSTAATPSSTPAPLTTPTAAVAVTLTPPTPTPTPSLSPTPTPTSSPLPSPTPRAAAGEPSPSPSPAPASPMSIPAPESSEAAVGGDYAIFGLIAAALGGWLIWGVMRRK